MEAANYENGQMTISLNTTLMTENTRGPESDGNSATQYRGPGPHAFQQSVKNDCATTTSQ